MLRILLRESWGLENVGNSKGIVEWETGLEEADVDCFLTGDGSLCGTSFGSQRSSSGELCHRSEDAGVEGELSEGRK
eukprot:768727-Hanusia_phi.AAC.2